ncbi:putative gamma-glutamylcyclotransferase At3g02910 [Neltuma alba]|uniref:putative gamma-glutamylcyclotransferase At3g02910 n=1 Tax=Neltuma alba TaxID=207710 RepID=UPI0010A3C219|nr:putative gamma-glutamylcyclotransferase At3g02910 [Prosopis alba]
MSEAESEGKGEKLRLMFTYGTLKRGLPNHTLLEDLIGKKDAVFRGSCVTTEHYPLVCGLYGVPYLIHLPGSGHQIKGELYGVTSRGLARLDELEGVTIKHYERRPIRVAMDGSGEEAEAEAYFAHGCFGEALWKKRGVVGMSEYTSENALDQVRIERRAQDRSLVDELLDLVGSAPSSIVD